MFNYDSKIFTYRIKRIKISWLYEQEAIIPQWWSENPQTHKWSEKLHKTSFIKFKEKYVG